MCWLAWYSFEDAGKLDLLSTPLEKRAVDAFAKHTQKWLSLYHAQFKITDIFKNTSQPLVIDGVTIAFVGEIYNYIELQESLWIVKNEDSFTEIETLFHAYRLLWESFVERLIGEFTIFLFDKKTDSYFLYRDYWGTKSAFYSIIDDNLFFSSSIKSFPFWIQVDKKSFTELSTFLFVEPPFTLYEWILSVPRAHFLKFQKGKSPELKRYSPSVSFHPSWFFESLEQAVISRLPKDQRKVSLSLSGWYDSNILLFFLKKHYRWEIITYTFLTDKNREDVEVAKRNATRNNLQHIIVDTRDKNLLYIDKIVNINGIDHLDIFSILKHNFPEFNDIKVDFWWDAREEILLANVYNLPKINSFYEAFRKKGVIREKENIDDCFLNYNTLNYNLQIIEELTYPNGIERRMPFSDQRLLYSLQNGLINKEKYRDYLTDFFLQHKIETVWNRKYGFCDGNNYAPKISLHKV